MGSDGRRPFPGEGGDAPSAASVRRRGPGGGRAMPDAISGAPIETLDGGEPDYENELEPDVLVPGGRPGVDPEGDERRRLERLAAPPVDGPSVSDGERRALVADCLDAIMAQRMIPGASDLLARTLAERLGVGVEEAERLLSEEAAGRARPRA